MDYQELFNYMAKNHDVNLLESEMQEVVIIVKRMLNNDEAPNETPNVNNNEVQKEDFCALLDELIVYGSNNGWWSRTIDLMKQLKQKYD